MSTRHHLLGELASKTADIYERNAARWDTERPKGLHELAWLDRFTDGLRPKGKVLDLGCGAGDPIAIYLQQSGFEVTGVDISSAMIELARDRMPRGDWREGDMRSLALGERFDGIIAWNSFFHLTPAEQRSTLRRIAEHLVPGGRLMVTVGPEAGEVVGHVGDDKVYHSSLAPAEYEQILNQNGLAILEFVKEDPECNSQTVLLAQKKRLR